MHPSRRRKKRPNYGIRTVEVLRGPHGFGFTISGQQPCILSCIVQGSPADHAGLRAGDFLISVNGISVSKITHDAVVNLIGNCVGPIKMTIAENYYSDSSEEELDVTRMVSSRKPKYTHKPRGNNNRPYKHCEKPQTPPNTNNVEIKLNSPPNFEDEGGPIEYKALVGYLGTIEMPKQLLPNSRLQTVCSCIRKLRQEKRAPTAVLMTIFPTCLTLKNSSNHILAIYPTNRVAYIGSPADREPKYFGLVTSAVGESAPDKKVNNTDDVEISNSCHVFMVDPKITDHSVHVQKAELFKFTCTSDVTTGACLEFPSNALYIVNLVQSMYKLQGEVSGDANLAPVVANSPQPSASSNSDSGIGFRDDCGNISDRILVVEFPANRPPPVLQTNNNRPAAIDASSVPLESLDLPLNNNDSNYEINNVSRKNLDIKLPNNLSKSDDAAFKIRQKNNLNNIRACENVNIKNVLDKTDSNLFLAKQNNDVDPAVNHRLTCRAMPDRVAVKKARGISPSSVTSSDDNVRTYQERPVDVPAEIVQKSTDLDVDCDNLSNHSSKSAISDCHKNRHVFKTPKLFDGRKFKKHSKIVNSCENLDRFDDLNKYKLSPKVYGLSKPNHSCEELNNLDCGEKYNYGSLQDLSSWSSRGSGMRNIAQSEPDVRMKSKSASTLCDEDNGNGKCNVAQGPAGWATSFERLLEDPLGLHTFAEFLKKEFSAENIYFWTACERFRRLASEAERVVEAQRICQQHLCVGAPEPVNVDAQARHCAEQTLQQANCHMFDQAQKQIFNLMKFDSYPRFLKSTLYKECLSGTSEKPQLDAGLLLQPMTPGSKLKKSLSNAEDRRRKSLLPWHRKNRSKSRDRCESDYDTQKKDLCDSAESVKSDVYSSKSSLTSLDLALTSSQDIDIDSRSALCRVILSNGSTTVVQIRDSETIQQLVGRLLVKRGLVYSAFEVYTDKHPKAVDVMDTSKLLSGCEVTVEQRVVFKLDLPNRKVISVKSKYSKVIADVLTPILLKYNYHLDRARVTVGNDENMDLSATVLSIDGARLKIHCSDISNPTSGGEVGNPAIKVTRAKSNAKLDEITNQVFEGILKEKADLVSLKSKCDNKSVKSEDWGSEHSSGILGRFLRRDSGLNNERKKKTLPKAKVEDGNVDATKKLLIAKLKTGANKLQVSPCMESDDLVEGLTRAQRSRLEDQRGTEINFELPDFLKDNKIPGRKSESSRFYVDKTPPCVKSQTSNYENRNVSAKDFSNNNNSLESNKVNNFRIYSPKTNNPSVSENQKKMMEPPPLPPKPKIIPIKPSNWGQNGFVRPIAPAKEVHNSSDKTLYLEQPSSSFV